MACMYSLRRPPCTTSPFIAVATGLKPFWQPRAPARARAPERCHLVPFVSADTAAAEAITAADVDLARVSAKGGQLEAAFTARRFVAGVVHHSCRLGSAAAAAARQRGSEAAQTSASPGGGRMGTVCARRSQQIGRSDETALELVDSDTDIDLDVQENWQRVVRRAQRLGVIRRRWAVTGHWLREVKARGRR